MYTNVQYKGTDKKIKQISILCDSLKIEAFVHKNDAEDKQAKDITLSISDMNDQSIRIDLTRNELRTILSFFREILLQQP